MTPKQRQPTERRGFTLIEVATVGACLAVVVAALPPALEGTRERARSARCQANLGRLAAASATYSQQDPTEALIPLGPTYDSAAALFTKLRQLPFGFGGKAGFGGLYPQSIGINSTYGWIANMGSEHRPLNSILYKNEFKPISGTAAERIRDTEIDAKEYHCPADDGFQGNHFEEWYEFQQLLPERSSSYDFFGTSYCANVLWVSYAGENCCVRSNSPALRASTGIPNPGNTLLYMENVGRYSWMHHDPSTSDYGGPLSSDYLPAPEYPESLPGPEWHGAGWHFNAAFADGHIATIQMKSYVPVDPYPDDLVGDCDPTERCKWVMVRGSGWQLDTLPAQFIESIVPNPQTGRPSRDGGGILGWPSSE